MSTGLLHQNNKDWLRLFRSWHNQTLDTESHLDLLLNAGTNFLGLDVGIISHIDAGTYTVEHFVGGELTRGAQFKLGHTYCAITSKKRELVAINHMAISEFFRHPCYEAFKLECYIGTPIFMHGELYGTVNFSSTTPRENPFTFDEQIFVQLIGEAVNWSLHAPN